MAAAVSGPERTDLPADTHTQRLELRFAVQPTYALGSPAGLGSQPRLPLTSSFTLGMFRSLAGPGLL